MEKKWGKGYQCPRCGHGESYKGKTRYHKRCKQCGYDESVTANTVFHGMRMPLLKTFYMIFRLTAKKKGMIINHTMSMDWRYNPLKCKGL